jgi:hypothetical protein
MRSLRVLVVHQDFFHSLAIISALFFASLLDIFHAENLELDLVGLEVVRRTKAGGSEGMQAGCWCATAG